MKPITREVIIFILCLFLGYVCSRLILNYFPSQGKYINCNLSEISPDFTPQTKEQCRKLKVDNK